MCFRCERRMPDCRRDGCNPYKHPIKKNKLQGFVHHLDNWGKQPGEVRYTSDCIDVDIVCRWARASLRDFGERSTLLGLVIIAHFNSVRTWGCVNHAVRKIVDWQALTKGFKNCTKLFGNKKRKKPIYALYSASCMSGTVGG